MRNEFSQIIKTLMLYITVFVLVYPYNLIICSISEDGLVWFILICFFMCITGIALWFLLNHKYAVSITEISVKKISHNYFKKVLIQFLVMCILFVIASIKEYNQFYYLPVELFNFWNGLLKNEKLATFFSYRTFPMVNAGYILITSISWIFYNLAQVLFDKRVRCDYQVTDI